MLLLAKTACIHAHFQVDYLPVCQLVPAMGPQQVETSIAGRDIEKGPDIGKGIEIVSITPKVNKGFGDDVLRLRPIAHQPLREIADLGKQMVVQVCKSLNIA